MRPAIFYSLVMLAQFSELNNYQISQRLLTPTGITHPSTVLYRVVPLGLGLGSELKVKSLNQGFAIKLDVQITLFEARLEDRLGKLGLPPRLTRG